MAEGGVLLVPSFAIGRTQEVVWALRHLLDAGRIPQVKLFLDSPMASKASTIYREHTRLLRPRDARAAEGGRRTDRLPGREGDAAGRPSPRLIDRAKRPYVLVASNGMLTGGRVLNHLRTLIGDTKAMILFVGYQGEGTLGRPSPGRRSRRPGSTARSTRSAAPSDRSAASRPTPTSRRSWPGWATSSRAARPATRACRGRSSSSTAIPTPSRRSSRRSQALGLPTHGPALAPASSLD